MKSERTSVVSDRVIIVAHVHRAHSALLSLHYD